MVSSIGEVAVFVSDLKTAKEFYIEALGFQIIKEDADKKLLIVGPTGSKTGIHLIQPVTDWRADYEAMWAKIGIETGIVLYCENLDELVSLLKENDLEFNKDVTIDKYGRKVAAVYDPDYNQLLLKEAD